MSQNDPVSLEGPTIEGVTPSLSFSVCQNRANLVLVQQPIHNQRFLVALQSRVGDSIVSHAYYEPIASGGDKFTNLLTGAAYTGEATQSDPGPLFVEERCVTMENSLAEI